jgi:hypothetical protein
MLTFERVTHPDDGFECPVCKRPVFYTVDGWKDENGKGSHKAPSKLVK